MATMFGCLPEGGTRVSDISIVVFKEYVGRIDGLKIVNSVDVSRL